MCSHGIQWIIGRRNIILTRAVNLVLKPGLPLLGQVRSGRVESHRIGSDRIGWLLAQSPSFLPCHAPLELLTHCSFNLLLSLAHPYPHPPHLPSFPHVSSIVTIGPVFLLGLLGITFYLGSRPLTSTSRRGGSLVGISNRSTNRSAVGLSSSGATALSITGDGVANPEQGATSASAASAASSKRVHGRRRSSTSTNTATSANIDNTTSTDSGMKRTIPVVNSVSDSAPFDKSVKGKKEEVAENDDDDDDAPPSRGGILTRRRSVRRIWKDGPGDDADMEQVGENEGHT